MWVGTLCPVHGANPSLVRSRGGCRLARDAISLRGPEAPQGARGCVGLSDSSLRGNRAERLAGLGIPHSGVKEPPYTKNAMLTFRDPDNIQLEFFWRAPK